jgi:type I restriction enzyme S subunit
VEIRPGYKQTEVGVIPEEWALKPLGDVADFLDGRRRPVKDSDRAKMRGDIPYYGASGIVDYVNDYLFDEDLILLGEDGENILSRNCRLAFKISGKSWVNNHAHVLRPRAGMALDYLVEFLESRDYEQYNTGTAQPKLNKQACSGIPVLCPPLPEQRSIAAALSDVDALLGGLNRLIAKKRDLKQAAMQQLLTGLTRLPGFSGEWEVKRLGDVAHIKTGSRNNEDKAEDGEYPFFVRSEVVERINSYSHDCEAILVPGEGRIGEIFHYINGRFDVHQRVYAITRFKPGVSGKFVHLYMAMNFGPWAMQNTVKATVDSLRLPTFQAFELLVPPTSGEQTAIAAILSDMDAELAALEARRDKTHALKQAMMQELLTGSIRLV